MKIDWWALLGAVLVLTSGIAVIVFAARVLL